MLLTLKKLDQQLEKGQVSPLYFIMGPEIFLVQESLRMIQSHVLSPEALDFNYEVFYVNRASVEAMRSAVETLPIFSKKRVVVCEEAQNLKESDWKLIEPIVMNPVSTCVLIFISRELDKRRKITKQLMSYCTMVSAQTPKESEWPVWIKWMGQKKGLTFSATALELLKNQAGYHLIVIKNEIEKLAQFLGDKKQVSIEDVLKVVPRTRPENIFALSRAIGQRKLSAALLCWTRLLEDNQSILSALALITRHIRILARIKEGVKKGHTHKVLCQHAGVPFFVIHDYIQEASLWTEHKIMSVMEILLEADRTIKSSGATSVWMENCIIKACL